MKRGRGESRNPAWKKTAALFVGLAVLGLVGAGVREIFRSTGGGALVSHGPLLVPPSLIFEGLPAATADPAFSLPQFIIRNSAFIIHPFWGALAFAQGPERRGLRFFKADITGSETVTTVAGSGPTGDGQGGFAGDGGPATSARLNYPYGIAIDASGSLFVSDSGGLRG